VTATDATLVGPWADAHTARRTMAVLRDVLPDFAHVVFDGPVAPAWLEAAGEAGFDPGGGARSATVAIVTDPGVLPDDAAGVDALIERLRAVAAAVVLATVSPASTASGGRWPAFWVDPFTAAGWTFDDAIRAALWDDGRVPLDCKEGLLLFRDQVDGQPPMSPATAMLHPHRAVELTMAVESRFNALLAQRGEQQALRDGLVRDLAAKHALLQLRLDLANARLGALLDRLFLVTASAAPAGPEPTWRRVVRRLRAQPAPVAPVAPDRAVWELFDPSFYRLQVPDAGVDPLRHYLEFGEAAGLRPNPWFDPKLYLELHEDVAAAGVPPFDHYSRYGGYEGRRASAEFDTGYYLAMNPDVRAARVHPMLHYMLIGRWEGRAATPPET
jgi:hypothetical protein